MHRIPPRRRPRRPGFTIVELLVSIAIVVALAATVFTVTKSVRRSALKASDMSNLRSLAAAAMAAGTDNSGRFPRLHASNAAPYWLAHRDTLQSNGISREACYIPNPDLEGGPPNYTWWYGFGNDTPIHYCYLANDAPSGANPWFLGGTVKTPTKEEYRGSTPYTTIIREPARAFPRNPGDDAWYTVLWAGLCRDYPGKPRIAAIMDSDEALGVNVIHVDGHGEWIDRGRMEARYTTGSGLKIYW